MRTTSVLIGGGACDVLMEEAGLEFRATKDLDLAPDHQREPRPPVGRHSREPSPPGAGSDRPEVCSMGATTQAPVKNRAATSA
jgi:hypothetical protein